MISRTALIGLLTWSIATPAWAQDKLDALHDTLSNWTVNLGAWIDARLSGEPSPAENNRSRLRLGMGFRGDQRENWDLLNTFDIRLALPITEKKLKLIVIQEEEEDLRATQPQDELSPTPTSRQNPNKTSLLAIRALEKHTDRILRATEIGFVFEGFSPGLYVRWRNRDRQAISKDWTRTLRQEIKWQTEKGWSGNVSATFDNILNARQTMRYFAGLYGYLDDELVDLRAGMTFFNWLANHGSFAPGIYAVWSNQPRQELVDWRLKVDYTQSFLKPWLVLSIVPELIFDRQYNYDANGRITVKLTATFGEN